MGKWFKKLKGAALNLQKGETARSINYGGNNYVVTSHGRVQIRPKCFDYCVLRKKRKEGFAYLAANKPEVMVRTLVAKAFMLDGHEHIQPGKGAWSVQRKDWDGLNTIGNLQVVDVAQQAVQRYLDQVSAFDYKDLPEVGSYVPSRNAHTREGANILVGMKVGYAVVRTEVKTGITKRFKSVCEAARDLGYSTNGAGCPIYALVKNGKQREGYVYKYDDDNFNLMEQETLLTNTYQGSELQFTTLGRVKSQVMPGVWRFYKPKKSLSNGRRNLSGKNKDNVKCCVLLSRAIACTDSKLLGQARNMLIAHGIPKEEVLQLTSVIWTDKDLRTLCKRHARPIVSLQVDHVDDDSTNDHVDNYQWIWADVHGKKSGKYRKINGSSKKALCNRKLFQIENDTNIVVRVWTGSNEVGKAKVMAYNNVDKHIKNKSVDKNGYRWEYEKLTRFVGETFKLITHSKRPMWVSNKGRAVIFKGIQNSMTYGSKGRSGAGKYRDFSVYVNNKSQFVRAHIAIASAFKRDQLANLIHSLVGDNDKAKTIYKHVMQSNHAIDKNAIQDMAKQFSIKIPKIEVDHIDGNSINNSANNLKWIISAKKRAVDAKRRKSHNASVTSKRAKKDI